MPFQYQVALVTRLDDVRTLGSMNLIHFLFALLCLVCFIFHLFFFFLFFLYRPNIVGTVFAVVLLSHALDSVK